MKLKGKKLIQLIVNDHSSLGGPMGTERTFVVLTKIFESQNDALEWAEKWVRKNAGDKDIFTTGWLKGYAQMSVKKKIEALADFGPYGIDFETITIS